MYIGYVVNNLQCAPPFYRKKLTNTNIDYLFSFVFHSPLVYIIIVYSICGTEMTVRFFLLLLYIPHHVTSSL